MRALVRVSGLDAEAAGRELYSLFGSGSEVSFDVERDVDPVALVGVVLAGAQTAKSLWDWWSSARGRRVSVTLVLDDGRVIEFDGTERAELDKALAEGP